ncbi:MAG: ABC-2 family transporter protein [Patescibacteria group bacterium]
MFKRFKVYSTVWFIIASNAVQETFVNRWSNVLFFLGKAIRLGMSLIVLLLIKQATKGFGQYSTDEMIVFFLTYQLLDIVGQIFYRGVYMFSNMVRSGEFDLFLSKPINPLFRALTGQPDINDVFFLIPNLIISGYILSKLNITITVGSAVLYAALLLNSFLIVTALHILVLTIGVITTEVDGVIWMYRDLIRLGQFPVSVYAEPLRFALFFIIPIGVMITIPAEVLLNTPVTYSIFLSTLIGVGSLFISLRLWDWGIKQYSSASS